MRARWTAALALGLALLFVGTLAGPASPAAAWPRRWRRIAARTLELVPATAGGRRFEVHTFDGHVHTDHSRDARHASLDVLSIAERVGLDTLIFTDHGSVDAGDDAASYRGPIVTLVGQEVGGDYGHAVIWNVRDRRGLLDAARTMPSLTEHVHARGGLVVLAHPGWWIGRMPFDPRRWMHADAVRRGGIGGGIDALELWNGQYHHRTRELLDEWVALLERGIYVPVVGNSDFHNLARQRLGTPFNAFLCEPGGERAACLMDAVRAGRLYVSDGPGLSLDVGGRTFGETLSVAPGARVPIALSARAPEGGTLEVFAGRERIASFALPPDELVTQRVELRVARDVAVRVEIQRLTPSRDDAPISLVSNPVLVDAAPARASWRGPEEGSVPPPPGYRRAWVPRSQRLAVRAR